MDKTFYGCLNEWINEKCELMNNEKMNAWISGWMEIFMTSWIERMDE